MIITLFMCLFTVSNLLGGDQMLQVGDPFPSFKLQAHNDSVIASEDLRGQTYLIYFYPKANTPGCTKEACTLRDRWEDAKESGLEIFGVSFDSPERNRKFAEMYKLPFLLLSDTDHSLAEACGASRALLPYPRRVSYLVDSEGVILKAYASVKPGTHADEVIRDLKTLEKKSGD